MTEAWMDEFGKNICPAPLSTGLGSMRDSHSARRPWVDDAWREDEIYALHERARFDDEFADYFEAAVMEER
jgi:hypothetical protein